jgi:hypothetical protein
MGITKHEYRVPNVDHNVINITCKSITNSDAKICFSLRSNYPLWKKWTSVSCTWGWVVVCLLSQFLVYFLHFQELKEGLWDHLVVFFPILSVFYVACVISKESKGLVLPWTSCVLYSRCESGQTIPVLHKSSVEKWRHRFTYILNLSTRCRWEVSVTPEESGPSTWRAGNGAGFREVMDTAAKRTISCPCWGWYPDCMVSNLYPAATATELSQ